jgi:acetyltransferase-like isoleucine patch superfamily enzyme
MTLDERFAQAVANRKDTNRKAITGTDFLYFLGNLNEHRFGRNLVYCRGALPETLRLSFAPRARDNIVIIGAVKNFALRGLIEGSDNIVYIGSTKTFQGRLAVEGERNLFFLADTATCNRANFVLIGDDVSIVCGTDCMLSYGISVRASDSHAIVDLKGKEVINPGRSILIHPHVWVGENATVLKGTTIERGAIVAAHAMVTKDVPACSLAVGIPAKVLRHDVSWTRDHDPSPEDIAEMLTVVRTKSTIGGLIRQLFPRARKPVMEDEAV